MSNSSDGVRQVTLTVETVSGEAYSLVVREPGPRGSNPRFMGRQFASAEALLGARMRNLIDARHGEQA